jgi:hypothetical protein
MTNARPDADILVGDAHVASRARTSPAEVEHSGVFTCSLVIADESGNSVRTSPILISKTLLPIYLGRMLPIARDTGFALEVSR